MYRNGGPNSGSPPVTGCPIICVFFLDINPGRAASMHWLAKRLLSTNRQKCQQFPTICPGKWVPGRRQHLFCVPALHVLLDWRTQHTFWIESIFTLFIAYSFQAYSPPQTRQTTHSFSHHGLNSRLSSIPNLFCHAAAHKVHQNILSFLTFTPWIGMKIQTEHWQWTSFHKNDLFYLLFLKFGAHGWSIAFV
jgi:hypothetical protein